MAENLFINHSTQIIMLLKDLAKEFRENHTFWYCCGNVEYQCKATYLPFGIRKVTRYEAMKLEEIFSPLIHLEWRATNTGKSIYQSHFIMSYSVVWWLNNRDKTAYDEMINYSAISTGYLDLIKKEDRRLNAGV